MTHCKNPGLHYGITILQIAAKFLVRSLQSGNLSWLPMMNLYTRTKHYRIGDFQVKKYSIAIVDGSQSTVNSQQSTVNGQQSTVNSQQNLFFRVSEMQFIASLPCS
ncbi:hypothetical protein H6G27_02275 [Nostoc linckia FACHB-104]|nr:hypothetical protein [Nostoc linckia FACHB-104]